MLPEDRCLLLTDGCVALLVAKGLAAAQRAAEAGAAFPASPLPQAPVLRWAVSWRDVLAAEARRSGPDAAVPDRVLMHRIGSGGGGSGSGTIGRGDDGDDGDDDDLLPLALGIRTHSGWCQAEAIAATLERAAESRGVAGGGAVGGGSFAKGGAAASGWGTGGSRWERAAAAAERASTSASAASAAASSLALASPSSPALALPPSLPCLDFKLVWTSRGVRGGGLGHRGGGGSGGGGDSASSSSYSASSSRVSLWRPVPPPGYAAAGDVAVLGVEPPVAPVAVYRLDDDDGEASDDWLGSDDYDGDSSSSTKRKHNRHLPPTAPAAGFRLVWRHDGDCPLTLWEPLPPRGYRALGAAACGSAEPLRGGRGAERARSARRPRAGDVACVRSDLCEATRCFDAPVWTADPIAAAAASAAAAGGGGFGRAGAGAAAAAAAGATPHPFDPAVWRVSLWPVDAPSGSFIALRSLSKPADGVALKAKL